MTMSEVYPTPGKIRIYPAATTQTAQKTSTSRLQPTKKQANHTVADFFSSLLERFRAIVSHLMASISHSGRRVA